MCSMSLENCLYHVQLVRHTAHLPSSLIDSLDLQPRASSLPLRLCLTLQAEQAMQPCNHHFALRSLASTEPSLLRVHSLLSLRSTAQPCPLLTNFTSLRAGPTLSASTSRIHCSRSISTSSAQCSSSRRWTDRQRGDQFARAAKVQGLKSRAAFKLLQINDRYRLFKTGMTVVDLGFAPGSWSQV